MKHLLTSAIVLAFVSLLVSCGSGGNAPNPQPKPTEPRVVKQVFATGSAPNDMVYANDSLYIANSLDNTVVRYAVDGTVLATATFDVGASPAYLAVGGDILWVVCNGNNTLVGLSAANLAKLQDASLEIASSSSAFIGPAQASVLNSWVFVPRAEIAGFSPTSYNPGLVSIFGYPEGSQIIPDSTAGLNPQFTGFVGTDLLVVCSGDIQFDENFVTSAVSDSYLERYQVASYVKEGAQLQLKPAHSLKQVLDVPEPVVSEVDALSLGPIGAGRIAVSSDGTRAYLGNSLNGNLYEVNLADMQALRGADNPIILTTDFTFVSDLAFSPDGKLLFCASFNTDEVYVVDTQTDAVNPAGYDVPFDLSPDPQLLAGCANLEVVPHAVPDYSYSVYVLHGVANSVSRIDIP